MNYQRTGDVSAPLWEYRLNLFDVNEFDGHLGPAWFEVSVGLYFPILDLPVVVERLAISVGQ